MRVSTRRCFALPGRIRLSAAEIKWRAQARPTKRAHASLRRTAMTAAPIHPTQANAEKRYVVTRADLPLSCPLPSMALWNSHPRVYLPIEAERECQCPYCGAHFVLADEAEQ